MHIYPSVKAISIDKVDPSKHFKEYREAFWKQWGGGLDDRHERQTYSGYVNMQVDRFEQLEGW